MKSLVYLVALLLCSQMAFAQSRQLPESIRGVSEVLKTYDAVVAGYHESNDLISVYVRLVKSGGSNANIACSFDANLSSAFANSRKWYHRNNNLVLIDDQPKVDGNAVIQIAKFNLTNGVISKEDLVLEYRKDADHNSFLYDDKLFVMVTEGEHVALDVYDFDTLGRIKSNLYPALTTIAGLGRGEPAIRVNEGADGLLEVRMGYYQQRRAIGRPWMMPLSEGGGMHFPKGTALRKSADDVTYVVELLDNDLEPVVEVK